MLTVPLSIKCKSCNKFCKRPIIHARKDKATGYYETYQLGKPTTPLYIADQRAIQIDVIIKGDSPCCKSSVTVIPHKGWILKRQTVTIHQSGELDLELQINKVY